MFFTDHFVKKMGKNCEETVNKYKNSIWATSINDLILFVFYNKQFVLLVNFYIVYTFKTDFKHIQKKRFTSDFKNKTNWSNSINNNPLLLHCL